MALLSTILAIVLALLKAAPGTIRAVEERSQREREATAAARQREKDARVDEAIARARSQTPPRE